MKYKKIHRFIVNLFFIEIKNRTQQDANLMNYQYFY